MTEHPGPSEHPRPGEHPLPGQHPLPGARPDRGEHCAPRDAGPAPGPVFTRTDPGLGDFALRALDPLTDSGLLHGWVTHPKAAFWMMGEARPKEVERAYLAIAAHPRHDAFLGLHRGAPAFLVERYDPARIELAGLYEAEDGDVGMHFLTAPGEVRIPGFTLAVLTTVMEFLFADPAARRVVVEPDVRNTAVQALNRAVGFVPVGEITKPEKTALLSFCTREQFAAARGARS
ncbi:acetyltransferase [Streptomyces sulfonofaciens]|uniref:Lysine N-acyltransferase MbtK n=1 Tax=Streptomyces sulfonofaciens TaxID=68272 RepID=A0A919L573_9ACTN|nr:GNAT family N-acetyltransferase [Streptomyces sulfonofaciens]GHH83126.1 acetyltransferase [Streptomyces sulfonofaciens]